MLSMLPTVISSSLRLMKSTSKSRRTSSSSSSSDSLSGSHGSSTPVRILAEEQAAMVSRYCSASRSRKWKRISSRPASANSDAHSGRNGMLVYMCRWKSVPNSAFRRLIPSSVLSRAISGSPPVIPAPVARIALASSITSSKLSHRRSLANM